MRLGGAGAAQHGPATLAPVVVPHLRGLWTRWSLTARLLLTSGSVLLLGGLTLLAVKTAGDAAYYREELEARLAHEMEAILPLVADQAVIGDYAVIQQVLDARAASADVARIEWVHRGGKITANGPAITSAAPRWFRARVSGAGTQGSRDLTLGGVPYGLVMVHMSAVPAQNRLWAAAVRDSSILAAALALNFLLLVVAQRRALAPLRALNAASRRLGQGDTSVRLAVEGSAEVRETIAVFNHTAATLESLVVSLAEQRDFLRSITENSADGIVTTGADGRISYFSPAAVAIFGRRPEEAVGRPVGDLCPDWSAWMSVDVAGDDMHGGVQGLESAIVGVDGAATTISASISPLRSSDGAIAGALAVARDVTAHRRLQEALRLREQRFRALIENSSDMITILDRDGTVTYASPSHARVLGWREHEMVGRTFVDLVHPDDVVRFPLGRGPMGPEPIALEPPAPGEVRLRHCDGSWRLIEVRVENLLDNPAVGGVVVNARDITDERHLESQVRQVQKMEAIGRLAGGVAHDFNNLLAIISGYSQLLLRKLPPDAVGHRETSEISNAADRAAALTRQLLAFSRRQVVQLQILDVNAIVHGTESMLRRLIGEDVELVVRLAPDLGRVEADPGHVDQLLLNLAANARDAMPDGGSLGIETLTVDGDAVPVHEAGEPHTGPWVMLAVTDTGCGMDAETQARVFEPFFTTKEPGRGTGLGLATVYSIVKQSAGHVTVESEPGRGTTFRIYLPCVAADQVAAPAPPTPPGSLDGSETVLVVEDEAALRGVVEETLASSGYTVLASANAAEAMQILATDPRPIHLVVTDVVMPGVGGHDLARDARRLRPGVKVLFMSGHTDHPALRNEVLHASAVFLQKPFAPHALALKVRSVLDEVTEDRPLAKV